MDYGGTDRRRTKKDLKRKRLARGYKRGGQFRTANVSETGESQRDDSGEPDVDKTEKVKGKKKLKKNRKY